MANNLMNNCSKDKNNRKEVITRFNNKYKKAKGILSQITKIYLRITVHLMILRFKILKLMMIDSPRDHYLISFKSCIILI